MTGAPAEDARPDSRANLDSQSLTWAVLPATLASALIALAYVVPGAVLDWVLPAGLAAVCVLCVLRIVDVRGALLTPLPWFLLSYAMYFGIGAAQYPFLSPEIRAYLDNFFPFSAEWARRTNVLNAVGLFLVLGTFALTTSVASTARRRVPRWPLALELHVGLRMVIGCLIMGYVARRLDSANTPGADQLGSGILRAFEGLTLVAVTILGYLVSSGHRRFLFVLVPVFLVELAAAVESLAKTNLLVLGIFLFLGVFWARPSRRLLVAAVTLGAAVLVVLQPLVTLGRFAQSGINVTISASNLIAILRESSDALQELESRPSGSAQARIAYGTPQAFAMDRYDHGLPGDTFRSLLYVFVPRSVWPNKPIMTPGRMFNELAFGTPESQSAPGVFAEAYWNGGWLYVVLTAAFIGLLFGSFTRIALPALAAGDSRWLPAAGIMMFTARAPDTWFVPTFVGSLSYVVLMLLGTLVLVSLPGRPILPSHAGGGKAPRASLTGAS